MERCDKHTTRAAEGSCALCGAKLCEECVSDRRDKIVLCYECAFKATTGDFEKWKKEKDIAAEVSKAQIKKPAKERISGFNLFLIISLSLIVLECGVIMTDYLLIRSNDVSYISSNTITKRYKLDLNAQNLHTISVAIESYKINNGGTLPKDIDALIPDFLDSQPLDPVSGLGYLYQTDNKNYTVICPTPEVHGMRYLMSKNGKVYYLKLEE